MADQIGYDQYQQRAPQHGEREWFPPTQHQREQEWPQRGRPARDEGDGMFSTTFKAQAWYSLAGACLESVTAWRNDSFDSHESTLAGKSMSYLAAELTVIAMIPVAVIEGIVRLAVSTLAYLVDVLGCIKATEEGDDTWYDCFKAGHVFALLAGIKSLHLGIANLNPWNEGIDLSDATSHFPVLAGVLNLGEVSEHFDQL